MIKLKCTRCGEYFFVIQDRTKYGRNKFCSRKCSDEAKIGKIAWNKGKKLPQISGENHPMWGKHHTKEAKRRIGLGHKGKFLGNTFGFKKGMTPWNKGEKIPILCGELNPIWKGDNVGYGGLHSWVKRHKGKPIICEHCKKTTGKIEWANIDHKYRRCLDDFISLCTSCHRKFDIENNNYYSE